MTLTGSADPAPGFRTLDDGSFRWNWCERLWEIVTLRSYGYHHLYLFCFGGLVILRNCFKLQIFWFHLFLRTWTLLYDFLSGQVTLRLTAHGFKFFYMFPGPYIRHVNDTDSYCMFSCLLPWLCKCSFWDFAATKVRLGLECPKLSFWAVIVDYLDQRTGVQSEGETAMTTGLRFLPGPGADSRRSSHPGKQWTLWR